MKFSYVQMYMYNFISNQEMLNRIAYFITYINIHHTNFPMSERSDKQHTAYIVQMYHIPAVEMEISTICINNVL